MAIIQSKVDPDYQGRVLTTMSSLMWLTTPVGLWIAGPVSDHFGIQIWYLIAGSLAIFSMLAGILIPQLRGIEDNNVNTSMENSQVLE